MQKIVMVGLDAAGKTCLLEKAFNLKDPQLLTETLPTQGVERQPYDFIGADMIIWDMGGQVQYRDRYLDKPEMLQGASACIFVVDIQAPDRFVEAATYWANILKTIQDDPSKKYIFYHKFDPDITEELKDNLVQARQIMGVLNPLLEKPPLSFATSIFSDAADRAARQVLWDILPPVELEAMPTVGPPSPTKETSELVEIIPSPEELSPIAKVSDRLAVVIEDHLHAHNELIALGIFKKNGEYVSGVGKSSSDKTLLTAASNALKNVGAAVVAEMESSTRSGPIQMNFGEFDVYFEIITPEHVAAAFCSSSPTPDMVQTISKINKSLNQALDIIPAEIERPEATKQTLMSELKLKLQQRRTLTDFQSRYDREV